MSVWEGGGGGAKPAKKMLVFVGEKNVVKSKNIFEIFVRVSAKTYFLFLELLQFLLSIFLSQLDIFFYCKIIRFRTFLGSILEMTIQTPPPTSSKCCKKIRQNKKDAEFFKDFLVDQNHNVVVM